MTAEDLEKLLKQADDQTPEPGEGLAGGAAQAKSIEELAKEDSANPKEDQF